MLHRIIKQATQTARDMVTKYGFSDRLGLINYASSDEDEVFIGRDLAHTRPYGEDVATLIDKEVKDIVDECYAKAKKLISEHMDVLKKSSELLLERKRYQGKNLRHCLRMMQVIWYSNQVIKQQNV